MCHDLTERLRLKGSGRGIEDALTGSLLVSGVYQTEINLDAHILAVPEHPLSVLRQFALAGLDVGTAGRCQGGVGQFAADPVDLLRRAGRR